MAIIKNDRDILLQGGTRILSTSLSISASNTSFSSTNGITTPTSIVLTATLPTARPSAVKTWTYAKPDAPDTWLPLGIGDTFTVTRESFIGAIGEGAYIEYKCYVTEPLYDDIFATYKISYSSAGVDAYSAQLSNEEHTLPISISGLPNYTDAATTMSVFIGQVDDSANWTYAVTKSAGVTCTEAISSRTQTVTGVTAETSTITFVASKAGFSSITKVFNIIKGIAGAVTANLSNDSHVLPTTTAGVVTYTGAATTMTVYIGATDDSANWTYAVTKSAGVTCTEAITSRTQTVTALTANSGTITIVASKANYTSITKVFSLAKAVQGDTGKGYTLSILGGTRALVYDKDGLNPSPAQTAFSATLLENGTTIAPSSYSWSASGVLSGTATTATFTPGTPAAYSATATTVTLTATYTGGVSVTQTLPIAISKAGADGTPGTSGTKSITITAFKWSNAGVGTYAQAITYTWATGAVSARPTGWDPAASTSPGTGYTLYQISLVITDTATATTTATNWSSATSGSIGYTETGAIGLRGDSARIAYTKSTIASPTGTTTSTGTSSLPSTGSFGLTSAVFSTSPPALTAAGEFLYQTDGIYTPTGSVPSNTITWQTPYLSNLKVGSLSAISANMGVVNIASGGNINSGKTSATDTTAGFFLGNDGGVAKFSVGDASNAITWNGTSLSIGGVFSGNVTGNINGTAANTVVTNASTAVTTANTANTNASAAVTTANTANTTAGSAVTTAGSAVTTANTANTNASTAVTTANTANTNASAAVTTANTANTNASSALSGLTAKLSKAGDTITGRINLSVTDGIFAGTDLNNGVYFGSNGIVGKKASATTFAIGTDGTATFGGALTAATGTFAGSLSAATGTFSGSLSAATGTFSGTLSASSITSGTFTGLTFQTAASGARVAINVSSNNMLQVYNASGIACELGGASGVIWATSNSSLSSTISGTATGALNGISGTGASGYGGYFTATAGTGVYVAGPTYAINAAGKIYQANGGTAGEWNNYFNSVLPVTTNAYYCGYTGSVWAGMYSQTALVVTSDIRKKKDIENCDLGLGFINRLRPVTYRMLEGRKEVTFPEGMNALSKDAQGEPIKPIISSKPGSRRHYGLIAQEVKELIGELDCGFWTIDDIADPESAQGLRYEELIAPMLKAIQELSVRIVILESKLERTYG